MLLNRKYWGNLARKEWLVNGNRNLQFFQNKANSRRKRKLLMKLWENCDVWMDDYKAISEQSGLDYTQIFIATRSIGTLSPNLGLMKLIFNFGNNELIKLSNFGGH